MRMRWQRLVGVGFFVAALACSVPVASAADKISIAVVNSTSDVALFIAQDKGYYKDEGLEASFVQFDSGATMTSSLGTGQLDIGAGAASAGLYNAVERGIKIKIVADKAHNVAGAGFQALMVRKALVDSGAVKSIADLKGRKVAITAKGSSDASVLNEAMKSVGLTYDDIEKVYLGFPQQVPALENGAIDAAISTEPTVTNLVKLGAAVRFTGDDAFYPNAQTAVIQFGGDFTDKRPAVAERFMKAYLRAVRDFNDALVNGRLTGPGADEIVAILAKYSVVKDPVMLRTMIMHGCDPDGQLNMDSLRKDLAFFKETGDVTGPVSVDDVVDTSFVAAAVKELGPYVAKR
jgi:NitT/TauT family transport system substrate-binding protein